jgi:putative DNA primase/helicase
MRTFDLFAFIESLPPKAPQAAAGAAAHVNGQPHAAPHTNGASVAAGRTIAAGGSPDILRAHYEHYAAGIFADECSKISSAAVGDRNCAVNRAAFALGTLVAHGFLSQSAVADALETAAGQMSEPLAADAVRATITSGLTAGLGEPRDLSEVGTEIKERLRQEKEYREQVQANLAAVASLAAIFPLAAVPPPSPTQGATQGGQDISGAPDNPHRLARSFLWKFHQHADGLTLRYWRDEFYSWNGTHWHTVPRGDIIAKVNGSIEDDFTNQFIADLVKYKMAAGTNEPGSKSGKPPAKSKVTTRITADVIQALTSINILPVAQCASQPSWIGPKVDWKPTEVLPMKNGLLHLPSLLDGADSDSMRPTTPLFFSLYGLSYPYDPSASLPQRWFEFLDQLWPNDPESIDVLQEWIGYLLTPDTSLQKMMLLTGPRRSGKGTIIRVISSLIGKSNVAYPTMSSLGLPAGLGPLVGKNAAIITEARVSGKSDNSVVVERLLGISGEDEQQIKKLYKDEFSLNLYARFMIVSNELPNLKETSTALVGRMIFLKLTRSFYGSENHSLFAELLPELPGILRWAIQGWARLHERGRFIQPSSGVQIADEMEGITSPTRTFLMDCCKVGGGDNSTIPCSELFMSWCSWCQSKGHTHAGNEEIFGRNIRAAYPEVNKTRPRINGKRVWVYEGIRLLTEWEENESVTEGERKEDLSHGVPF